MRMNDSDAGSGAPRKRKHKILQGGRKVADWLGKLTPEELEEWDEFVRHYREDVLPKMEDSAVFMTVVTPTKVDIKFAVELGMAIMLEKPIITMVLPGARVPEKLRAISEAVVHCDMDTGKGRDELIEVIRKVRDAADRKQGHDH